MNKFPLLRQFSIISLVAMIVTAFVLILLFRQDQLAEHSAISAKKNLEIAHQITHFLDEEINQFITQSKGLDAQALRNNPHVDLLTSALNLFHKNDLAKLKIYNLSGVAIYSSARNEIGTSSHHPEFLAKALAGETTQQMDFRESFFGRSGELHNVSISLLYMPLTLAGERVGVIEIYTDSTAFFNHLQNSYVQISLTVMGIFVVLYGILFFAVFRADRAIDKWKGIISERDESLRESHRFLKAVLDEVPVRIFWKDKNLHYLGCNPAFAEDAGVASPQDIIGKDDYQLSWKEQAELYCADDRRVMESGVAKLSYEEPQTTPDGKTIWVSTSKVSLQNSAHETIGVLGIYQDVTEQKQATEQLKEQVLRNQLILQATQDGFWLSDLEGRLREVNETYCRMSGYSMDELLTMHISDVEASENPAETQTHIQRILETGFDCFETRHRRKDGSILELEVSTALVGEGKDRLFFAFLRDITERKQSQAELRIAATAFETHESLIITDANSVIIRANQAFIYETGYASDEIIGQTPRLFRSGHHDEAFYKAMWEIISRTGKWQGEVWDRRKNGEIYPKWLTISAVKGANGSVTHYVGSHIDITERKAAENEIQHLAFYDPLTQLPNRRLLMDRLQQAFASSTRSNRDGALLFLDLDNFKNLNDTLGHDIGDLLLQQVALRLQSCVREGDTVARLGGDEFVLLLEDLSEQVIEAAEQAEAIGKKILAVLNQPYQLAAHKYHSTPSIGVTLFNGHQQAMDELMQQADIAMYQAKQDGRNTLRFFDPKMQETINARATLEGELRNALERQQFHLYYQIQVDDLKQALGAEVLIRWIHPEHGMISPMQFIPLAEETGLILPIGLWVLETACAQLKAWEQNALTRDLVLAVNVSARQFSQADFVVQVQAVVQRFGINPARLKLELTESMLVENVKGIIATMSTLKEMGIQFSLDDFGTGYSSLQYLQKLPLDQLKIDQSFVRDMAVDAEDNAIVQTIIAMAKGLKLDIIAEGVETEEQRQLLHYLGCDHYQGYLFGKPVPIAEFEALLK